MVKAGRTHLMDATPVTLGQEFSGYAAQVRYGDGAAGVGAAPAGRAAAGRHRGRHRHQRPARLRGPGDRAAARATGLPFTEARNHFEAQGARDALVEPPGSCAPIAGGLYKIANDIRWMGSGPRAGLGEIHLPDLQPGSSIMPGKVNPVHPGGDAEVCAQVIGNDAAVTFAGAQGDFELNVMLPVIARNLLESIRLLANVARLFADRCVAGIDRQRGAAASRTRSVAGDRHPAHRHLGYDEAAEIAKEAARDRAAYPGDRVGPGSHRGRADRRGRGRRDPGRPPDDRPLTGPERLPIGTPSDA